MDKNHPAQNLPDKGPPDKNPPRTIETEFAQGAFARVFCVLSLGLLKIGGSEMCDVLAGVQGCVTGEGGYKLAKNSVTYFMDGPHLPSPPPSHDRLSH